jgi:alpha-L-rhamnosidase
MSNTERVSEAKGLSGWKKPSFDDSAWVDAGLTFRPVKMLPIQSPWKLTQRTIPMLPENAQNFDGIVKCDGSITHDQWTNFINGDGSVTIPAGETAIVDVECASLTTAFVNLQCGEGKGSVITLLYAECYEKDLGVEVAPFPMPRTKSVRSDSNGRLYGVKDIYTVVDGKPQQTFEPFWFRAFRYVQLHIQTASQSLTLKKFTLRETSYPLDVSTEIKAGPELDKIWDISLRTLQNCRHETYEDCPFYEQNQFASDSRLQMLFTYQISSDDRLARKTLEEFHASRCPDGLIKAQFPAGFRSKQIPQFSLYWVAMVWDHMRYFADASLVRRYLSTVDGILNHFDERINQMGLVGQFDDDTWPFIDWVPGWSVPGKIFQSCMPQSYHTTGAATFNSLLYTIALMHAAELCDFTNRKDTATEYRSRAQRLRNAVNKHCFEDGLYLDGPASKEYSQHSQVFAVLSESVTGASARDLMVRIMYDSSLAQCSSALQFYVFRAVEKVSLYNKMFPALLDPWRRMLADDLTTWAEFEHNPRSDCHGWSACPINEIVTQVYGVRPGRAGSKRLRIEPQVELLPKAEGKFITPLGEIKLKWEDGNLEVEISSDVEAEVIFRGSVYIVQFVGGKPVTFVKEATYLSSA